MASLLGHTSVATSPTPMMQLLYSFAGDITSLHEELVTAHERRSEYKEDEEVVLFLEDLSEGVLPHVPQYLEAQLS